jgi:hypothetical protein
MSAFFLVAYAALSIPAVLAGLTVTALGLASTFAIFGAAVAALALFVGLQAWRLRPRSTEDGGRADHRPSSERPR